MTFSVSFGSLLLLASLVLSGCVPAAQSQLDEEKEYHFLEGKSYVRGLESKEAIAAFEKALQANPQSASAHFELACLFDQKEARPARAIYHYESYLELRPNAEKADLARQRIMACKQELARTVSLGPVTEKVQHDIEQLAEDKRRLTEENKRLVEELEKWRAYAARMQSVTNPATGSGSPGRGAPTTASALTETSQPLSSNRASLLRPALSASAGARTHKVKPGETPLFIARSYGIRLDALMAANPSLNPRRLQVGQTLSIPVP